MRRTNGRQSENGLNLTRPRLTAIVKFVSSLWLPSTKTALRLIVAASRRSCALAFNTVVQWGRKSVWQRDTHALNRALRRPCLLNAAAALMLGSLLLAGCGGPATSSAPSSETVVVTVFAAASLTDVFQEAAGSFGRSSHTGNVEFNFAGSQQLAGQLREGARADIFASADEMQMQAAVDAGRIEMKSVKTFACNRLMIGYGLGVTGGSDAAPGLESLLKLAQPGHKIVVGAEAVPIGQYTRQFLANAEQDDRFGPEFRAGFEANIVSQEQNVRGILSKLQLGEADAGVVYASDLVGSTELQSMEIPAHLNVSAVYPIALTQDSRQPEQAATFVTFLFSEEGTAVLESHGFSTGCRGEGSRRGTDVAVAEASDHAHD